MRVGLDISQVAHLGGVGIYTQNLATNLLEIKDLEMVFFYSSLRKPYKGQLKNVKSFRLPPSLFEILFNRIRSTNIEKFIGSIDLYHSSDWVQPPTSAKKVTTFHDLIPVIYPNWSNPKIVRVHKKRLQIVEEEIDLVIAVSESTKNDLLSVSTIPESKIKVIYEGVEDIYKPQSKEEITLFKKRYNLPEDFLLAVGGVGERKNISRIKKACKGFELVILGQTLNIAKEELPLLYGSSKALVYASLYEGFGLPILEAMACGTPVVTSNVSSMPEVAGDAAVLVDPQSVEDIRRGILKVLEIKDLLKEKGISRAKQFTWKRCAEETANLYKSLID